MDIIERVAKRLPDESNKDLLNELIQTITDRLLLRLGAAELPPSFNSICVDATVKMYRRMYYEGITSEAIDSINTSFINDILAEYDKEILGYRKAKEKEDAKVNGKVRFI